MNVTHRRLSTLVLVMAVEPTKNGLLLPLSALLERLLGSSFSRMSLRFAEVQTKARVKLEWVSRTLKVHEKKEKYVLSV